MDEVSLQIKANKAARAKALFDDELFKGAFIQLRHDYRKAWEQTDVKDTDLRERLWWATRIVDMVERHFMVAVQNGKLAQRDLDEIEQRRKRFKIV
jgi:hypothetical protein